MTLRHPEITNQVTPITGGEFDESPGLGTRQAEEAAGRRTSMQIITLITGAVLSIGGWSHFNDRHDTGTISTTPTEDSQVHPVNCEISKETQTVEINSGMGVGTNYVLQQIDGINAYDKNPNRNCHAATFSAINELNPGKFELSNGSSLDAGKFILPQGVEISFIAGPTVEDS